MSSVSLFNRYVISYYLHDLLLDIHVKVFDPIYIPSQLETFTVWFRNHGEIHSNSEFVRQLYEIIFQSLLPLGCRIDAMKQPETRDKNMASQALAEKEFGTDLVEQLRDGFMNIETSVIIQQPDHRYYDCILLCIFAFWFEQTLKHKWTKQYFVGESKVLFRHKELLRQETQEDVIERVHNWNQGLKTFKTPLCVLMHGSWLCYFDYKWYICQSPEAMLLTWCLLIKRFCHSQTSEQLDISPFFTRINLIDDSVESEF